MSNELGIDRSGNNNNWTVHSLDMNDDLMLDSPTNNFPTLNPLTKRPAANGILSHGNLKFTSQTGDATVYATMGIPAGQKVYFEVYLRENSNQNFIGVNKDYDKGDGYYAKVGEAYGRKVRGGALVQQYYNGGGDSSGTDLSVNNQTHRQVVNVAVDNVNGRIHYGFQGTWESDPTDNNPAANVTGFDTTVTQFPKISVDTPNDTAIDVVNFGQSSAFTGDRGVANNQDENGIGDFAYSVPAGYLALCTKNLPDVAVVPSEHFNTLIWSGNGSSTRSLTGVGFQPDFTWHKVRNNASSHMIYDSVRGTTKRLHSDQNVAEAVETASGTLTSFDSDGFSVDVGSSSSYQGFYTNQSGKTYVAWNWKANGSGSSNTDGDITSTVSANVDAGFSIGTYSGNGSTSGTTIGHGLNKKPDLIIVKCKSAADTWGTYHSSLGAEKYVKLDSSDAEIDTYTTWNDTEPTTSVFTVWGDHRNNNGSQSYVFYAFHSVDGYCAIGSGDGNGSADGTFNYTGFAPALVIAKDKAQAGYEWIIYDNKRDIDNPVKHLLYPSNTTAENSGSVRLDFLSNGFKFRESGNDNGSSCELIWIAFAETPFKYSNAR